MRMICIALAAFVLAGCASPKRAPERTQVVLSERAFDAIASARASEVLFYALSHIGVPYRYGGSSPESGFDCSGLVHYVYGRGAGLALPRNTLALSRIGAPVAAGELEPGDLVFFDTMRRPYSHVGIYLGERRFIHAPTRGGHVELVDLGARYWQSRFSGARRLEL